MNADAALAAFPELEKLVDLQEAGWVFQHWYDAGVLTKVNGLYQWPGGFVDAIRVKGPTDTSGMRCDHADGVLWELVGTLAEVVDGLLALPAPGRGGPQLVVASGPQLWMP
ncbi:MAG TPA: hypothetical protein VJT49_10525 [Amycolatopsis sp.]|uniref:hypothetical protein n=1 Tax=Amycolatopsis sp. TaxID=37632 RepID=UPI002B471E4A|nr:hypothetical protein [Amycolatopsis sp.]HKS45529.1 hypothetical protein [Amycolatopsis sp.]